MQPALYISSSRKAFESASYGALILCIRIYSKIEDKGENRLETNRIILILYITQLLKSDDLPDMRTDDPIVKVIRIF